MTVLGLFTKDNSIAGPDGITTVFYDENLTMVRTFCIERLPYLLLILAAVFCIALCILVFHSKKQPEENADYLIILGAHVNGTIPSRALMSRIMAAYGYLKENPHTKAVLTGGQGRGEEITEALCMQREFLKLGIEETRLLLEDQSTTTKENITFAKKRIEQEREMQDISVVVVTNDFHALRGQWLAKTAGFNKAESIGTSSSLLMKPHYYTREILSWIKLGVLSFIKKTTTLKTGEQNVNTNI